MIKYEAYDEKADVYSYAICLWELYTHKVPYRDLGLSPSRLVVKVVRENLRPVIPRRCPPKVSHF
jgi:serine/threonine protein kinase